MTNMCPDGKFNSLRVEVLCRGRPANPTRVFLAGMLCDDLLCVVRTARKELADAFRERCDIRIVEFRPSPDCPLPPGFTSFRIGQTFTFCPFQRAFLNQHSLAFVAFPGAAETHDDGVQGGVSGRSACEGGVATF